MKNPFDRFNTNGIVSAVELLYNKPTPSYQPEIPLVVSLMMSEVASEAVTLGGINCDPVYDPIRVKKDIISDVLSSVSNTVDPLSSADALINDADVSKFKMSVGATSALPPDISVALWCENESISLMIDLNNLEKSIELLEAQAGAVTSHTKDVTAEYLTKVWSLEY